MVFKHSIIGYVVGTIWMPAIECFKPVTVTVRDDETLREAALRATMNEGDFRGCDLGCAVLETTMTITKGARVYTRTRSFPLTMFPSIRDMVREDWFPTYMENED